MKNRKRVMLFGLLAASLLPVLTPAASGPVIQVRNGYVRGLPPGTVNTAAYMTLVNTGDEALVLTGAASPAAQSVSLHNTVNRGGMMSMEHVMSATLPAHGSLELKSGAMHLMLMGLKRPLQEGYNVELTLQFEGGFVHTIELPVISVLDEQ